MPIISVKDSEAIRKHLDKRLTAPLTIDYFTQKGDGSDLPITECAYCREIGQLLEEVTSLSDRIRLNVHDFLENAEAARRFGIERIPAFVLSGAAKGRVRYFGIPGGYEFSAFIEDLGEVAAGKTDLSPKAKEELAAVDRDIHIQVFVTPT